MSSDLNFSLHPKQAEVFQTPAREILYGGAAGGGKSYLMRVYSIFVALEVPNVQVYLFRRSYKDLKRNHITGPGGYLNLLNPLIKQGICKVNTSDMEIKFDNGATIYLCHIQHSDDKYSYQGAEINVLLVDESSLIEEDVLKFLRGRIRQPKGLVPEHMENYVPRAIYSSNPGGVSHTYLKTAFVDAAPWGTVFKAPDDDSAMDQSRIYIPAKLTDNPSLDYTEYTRGLQGLGNPELIKAMLEGSWDLATGAFFSHVFHRPTHVIEPFPLPANTEIKRCYDFGSSKPYSVLYLATLREPIELSDRILSKNSIIVAAELYGGVRGKSNQGLNETTSQQAERIKEFEQLPDFIDIVGDNKILPGESDSSIFARVAGYCIYDDFHKAGVHLRPADKSSGSIAIGLQRISRMLQVAADPDKSREEPGLYFFSTCWNIIRIIETIERDERNPEVVKNSISVNDHALDTLRYGVNTKGGHMKVVNFSF